MDDEIRELMNGINLREPIENAGLNQMRNIVNALDNLLTQINGAISPFQKKIEQMREFYFQSMIVAKNIVE